jgi:adenylate cyclase
MSATPDSTLASPEQLIADLRRQLAECRADLDKAERNLSETTTERDEALAREAATAEVLGVINSSRGALAAVFHAILEKARRLCDAAHGDLWTYDGEAMTLAATHGEPEFAAWLLSRGPVPIRPGSVAEQLIRGADHVQFEDPVKEQHAAPEFLAQMKRANIRSTLIVPMRKEQEVLGAFHIYRQEVRPFSGEQIALLQNFAAQAVIAMENGRLLHELRARTDDLQEALEYQTATSDVLQVISRSTFDLQQVLDTLVETAARLCNAEAGHIARREDDVYHVVSTFALTPEWDAAVRLVIHRPEDGTLVGRTALARHAVHIEDVAADPEHPNPEVTRLGKLRTLLGVPLLREGEPIGVISLARQRVEPFTERQVELIRTFADQAVIAIENVRLFNETREALEQQTATAEVLQVINSSPGDLAPVFDALLEKALRLCEAAFGVLWTFEGEIGQVAALRGVPPAFAEFLTRGPHRETSGTANSGLRRGENVVQIADSEDDDAYRSGEPVRRAMVELGGAHTMLAVPLRKDGTLLGSFIIYRQEVRLFSDKQIEVLQNFAAQAVIAVENARLLGELRQRTEEVAELNRGLEARVAEQVEELGRVGRLKRFLAPQLAQLIVSQGDEKILESHRREIVVVFCDLRGYTAFTETAEPEEVLDLLREYHGALGPLVSQFEGTLDQFSGDGIMVFFNDPVPCPDPAERAVKMAMAMREAAGKLIAHWRERGRDLGFGAGIAQGYATLGQIGFSERSGYTAIGTVCNVAARLCAEAKDGQILLSQRINVALKGSVATEQVGPLALKGLTHPVVAYNVPLAATQPALRIIEGSGPQSI